MPATDQSIKPPWVISPSIHPGDDPHWRTPQGRAWLQETFLPYYDLLSSSDQIAYCNRWNAPNPWVTLFLHPDMDEAMAAADQEDFGESAPALNYRRILLDS